MAKKIIINKNLDKEICPGTDNILDDGKKRYYANEIGNIYLRNSGERFFINKKYIECLTLEEWLIIFENEGLTFIK